MAILKAGKVGSDALQKPVSCLNIGGPWSITLPAEKTEKNYFRQSAVTFRLAQN